MRNSTKARPGKITVFFSPSAHLFTIQFGLGVFLGLRDNILTDYDSVPSIFDCDRGTDARIHQLRLGFFSILWRL